VLDPLPIDPATRPVDGTVTLPGSKSITNRALVCVPAPGFIAASIDAVYVDGDSKAAADVDYAWALSSRVDSRGDAYLCIDFSGTVTIDEEIVQAGISGGDIDALHKAIAYLLEAYSSLGRRRIHYGLIGQVQSRLGTISMRMLINGSGEDTSATSIDLLEKVVAASFPMLTFGTMDGKYGPIVTDGRDDPRADLVEGIHLLNRESDFEESDKRDLVNNFTYRYNLNGRTKEYTKVQTRDPGNSVLCSISRQIVGERFAEVVASDIILEDNVASMVVDWMAYHLSMPSYYVEYEVPTLVALKLQLGWNVRLFVPSFDLDGVSATITKRAIRRRTCTLGFRLWWPNLAGVASGGGASSGGGVAGGGQ